MTDAHAPDVGLEALSLIHRTLLIDEPWTARSERTFTWLAYRLPATIHAAAPIESEGLLVSRIVASIDVVEKVEANETKVAALLCDLNRMAVGHAYVHYPDEGVIRAELGHNVHQESVRWRATELASAHIVALTQAEALAEHLAQAVGGRIVVGGHPGSGRRSVPDDMLNAVTRLYVPAGREASRFRGDADMKAIESLVRQSGAFSAGSSPDGIAIEVAFGPDETTLIELKTDEPHPLLGQGLGVFMTVRFSPPYEEGCRVAGRLNRAQVAPGELVGALGAWTIRTIGEHHYLARSRFIPNVDSVPNLAANAAMSATLQAQWVDRLFYPHLPPRSAMEVLKRRLHGDFSN